MRYTLTLLLILVSSLFAYSQDANNSKDILERASMQYQKSKGIKLTFSFTAIAPDGDVYDSQKGTAFIRGDKFKLDLNNSTTWFDGTTQWVLLKDANEVNISNPSQQELLSISPLALLDMYKSRYAPMSPKSKVLNGKNVVEISMTPINKSQDFKNINLTLDRKTNNIVEINFTTNTGAKNKIIISEYDNTQDFTNDLFIFNKHNHPGVEIIDLR